MSDLIVLRDTFDEAIASFKSEIVESKPIEEVLNDLRKVDPILRLVEKDNPNAFRNVLGIIEGPYFVPNGKSRNKRFYPRELWTRVIQEEGPLIERKGRLGTLEHPEKPEEEHPRQASHVLKKLWINGKLGYGKSYVLNTPVGAIASSIFSATDESGKPVVPIYMSSRAVGRYLPGSTHEGMPVVDPNKFVFQTFDIVINPGFIEANPEFIATVETCIGEVCEAATSPTSFFIPNINSDSVKPVEVPAISEDDVSENAGDSIVLTEKLQRLEETVLRLEETVSTLTTELREKDASLLAIRFGTSRDRARKLLEKLPYEDVVDLLLESSKSANTQELNVIVEDTKPNSKRDPMVEEAFKRIVGGK